MKHPCGKNKAGQKLIEVTSTGLTHHVQEDGIINYVLARTSPDTFNTYEDRYFGYNYGVLDIEFTENAIANPKISIKVKDINGTT